jgi:hypothetical protein
VRVNVTLGSLRAVYLKHGAAAVFPADIKGRQCDATEPRCHMTWYERYDRYTGEKMFSLANSTVVPSGGVYPDKRAVGDWYISVQDAATWPRTEFFLHIDELAAADGASEDLCDRYGRYDCSHDQWKVPPDLFSSAATPRVRIGPGGAAAALSAAVPTAALMFALWHSGARRRRNYTT